LTQRHLDAALKLRPDGHRAGAGRFLKLGPRRAALGRLEGVAVEQMAREISGEAVFYL
jgi:hypothetical protein